jgi:hypothetical protein
MVRLTSVNGDWTPPQSRSQLYDGWDDKRGTWSEGAAKRIIDAVRAGNHVPAAAGYAGISKSAVYTWIARGRESRPRGEFDRADIDPVELPYVDFVMQLSQAEASAEVELVTLVRSAARENWQAAVQMLGRRFPQWRESAKLEVEARSADDETIAALQGSPALVAQLASLAHEIEDARSGAQAEAVMAELGPADVEDSPRVSKGGQLVDLDDDSLIELE